MSAAKVLVSLIMPLNWCCRNPVRVSPADSMPRVSDSAALMRLAIATLLGCHSEREDIINHGVLKVAVVRNRGAYLLLAAQHVFCVTAG